MTATLSLRIHRLIICVLTLTACTLLPQISQAACDKAQHDLASTLNFSQTAEGLVLNGYGTRTKLLWDVYLAALYLPQPSHNTDAILAMPGAKRISLYFLREIPKEKLIEGWVDGFQLNQTPQQLAQLNDRLGLAKQKFRTMQTGDVIHFDFNLTPSPDFAATTRLIINGQSQAVIAGQDFFNAILQIWIGEHPTQQPLKDCLLGIETLAHKNH